MDRASRRAGHGSELYIKGFFHLDALYFLSVAILEVSPGRFYLAAICSVPNCSLEQTSGAAAEMKTRFTSKHHEYRYTRWLRYTCSFTTLI